MEFQARLARQIHLAPARHAVLEFYPGGAFQNFTWWGLLAFTDQVRCVGGLLGCGGMGGTAS